MLLYFCVARPVYGRLIREGSPLYVMLKKRSDVLLVRYKDSNYYQVDKTGSWLDLEYSFTSHERKIVNGEVIENISFVLSSSDENDRPVDVAKIVLDINERRFPGWIHSEKAADYRKNGLLQIARQLMPDLL